MEWEFPGQGDGHEAQAGLKGPKWPEGLRKGTQGWSKGVRVTVAGDAITEVGRAMAEVWHTPFPRPVGATEGLGGGARTDHKQDQFNFKNPPSGKEKMQSSYENEFENEKEKNRLLEPWRFGPILLTCLWAVCQEHLVENGSYG